MLQSPPTAARVVERTRDLQAVALVLLSAASFGALAVLCQLAYQTGVSVLGLLLGRFLVAGTVLWLIVIAGRRPLPSRRGLLTGVALGAGYSSMALCFAASLKHIEAGLADLLLFAYPVLVSIGATALGRERFSTRRAIALVTATAGIALALTGGGTGVIDPVGVGLALTAALIYALYVLASSSLLATIDPLVLAASVATGAAIMFCADAAIHGQLAPRGGVSGIGLVVVVALSSSVLGTGAFMAGVRRLGASRASIVSSAEPALTAAFAFAAFGDRFGAVQLIGAGLVLASVPILELRRRPPSSHRRASRPATSGADHSVHQHNTEKGPSHVQHQRHQTAGSRHHPQTTRPQRATHPSHLRGDGADARRH
ncbi:MAG TPA: DMT family transporter [Solirubrobacteraceae bacterium]|jgi:drug/metabolite transporter (DMT)-like permease